MFRAITARRPHFLISKTSQRLSTNGNFLTEYSLAYTKVTEKFPSAQLSSEVLRRVDNFLYTQGCNANNTLYAQSVCSDEINFESGDVTDVFSKHFGEVFQLGGLAGIPFVGKTGFTAYSHHVPDGILFLI